MTTELEQLYERARKIATDFIGYPIDTEDETAIDKATPMQAFDALEKLAKDQKQQIESLKKQLDAANLGWA